MIAVRLLRCEAVEITRQALPSAVRPAKKKLASLILLFPLLNLAGCFRGSASILQLPAIPTVPSVSPNLGGPPIQGVAVDPLGHFYVSLTTAISAYDSSWQVLWRNSQPFSGIPIPVNHIGDPEYYGGFIYAPVENFASCTQFAPTLIGVYDAKTGILVNWINVTGDRHEASAVAVVPESRQVVVSSYCAANQGDTTLWSYDLDAVTNSPPGTTLAAQSTITLSAPLPLIQGISWDSSTSQFILASDARMPSDSIWIASTGGDLAGPIFIVPSNQGIELEGVDATSPNLFYADNGQVYGIAMPSIVPYAARR